MSSNKSSNPFSKLRKQDETGKIVKTNLADTANKENLLTDISAHLAVHAERMKLLKRAEEGLEKLSADQYISHTNNVGNEKEKLATTQVLETKKDDMKQELVHTKSKLPVSAARQRRREKQDGGKSQIQIKNYKPSYTWNRGGRVKELRIRCLARKFLYIWKRKVFGRVMPSQARHHYHIHIMKQAFNEWYDLWWHVRKEWRLMVRAECHFRYLAWTKHFEAWKEFISYKKDQKRKIQIAVKHNTTKTLKKSFMEWKTSVSLQKQKKKKLDEATKIYENNLIKKTWNEWKDRFDMKQHRKNIGVIALQFWAYRLQVQHWLLWCEAYKKRQVVHSKDRLAVRHHKFYTMQRALTAWINYWNMTKEKKAEKEYAQSVYLRSVLVRSMRTWVNQYNRRRMIHNHQAHLVDLANRFTMRRYLQRWLQYVELEHDKEEKQELALEHYTKKLKVLGLSAFRLCVVKQRMKEMQTTMADNFYVSMLTRRHWNRWMARCEHNEELAIHSLTVKAMMHYRMVICRKLIDAWMDYVEWRKHRQAQYDRADAYYYVRAMPVFLEHIKVHAELQKRNREYAKMALQFRRENLSARFFYMWYNNFEQSREDRMNNRMAILHYEGCTLKRFFRNWKIKFEEEMEDHKKEELAVQHNHAVLCRKHLRALKQYLDDLKTGEVNDAKATKHHYIHKLTVVFSAWKQFVTYKKQQKLKKKKADIFYRHRLYQRVMKRLKNNLIQGRHFKQIADVQHKNKCQQLVRWALQQWKENCTEQKEDKKAEEMAVCHYHRRLLSKIVTPWHRYAVIRAYKKSETRQWVENTRKILNQNKLQRYFNFWKKNRDECLLNRLKNEQAIQHYNRVLLQNLMIQWKKFVQISVKEKLLIKQCVWFNDVRLKSWTITVWKQEYAKTQETARKSALALWHWSLTLQKQVLVEWYMYTQDRKRKKSRINQALERRRTRLVLNGITQWLSVSGDLSGLRAKFAAQQHATKAFTLHQIVQKCALYWRHWAARRKSQHSSKTDRSVFKSQLKSNERPGPKVLDMIEPPVMQLVPLSLIPHTELVPERLVPLMSGSPARSKGLVPEVISSKRVEFKIDRHIPSRRKPRHPSFLAESLKKAGLFSAEQDSENTFDRLMDKHSPGILSELQPANLETSPKAPMSTTETQIAILPDINYKELSSDGRKDDTTSGLVGAGYSGQSSGLIGYASTLQVRGFCDKSSDKFPSETENFTQSSDKAFSFVTSDVNLDKNYNIQKRDYKTFENKLLTPADFLTTKMTSTLTNDVLGVLPTVGISPRGGERIDGISSINSTLKTKESADFMSTGNESSKFKESSGFVKSTDDTTPRSADSLFPVNIESPRAEKKGTVLANQITDIRDRLKGFNEKKKRLRKLQKQHVHLSDWLEQEVKKSEEVETDDIKKEIVEIEEEMKKLNQEIDIEKPMCARLVSEVQILVKLLNGSEKS